MLTIITPSHRNPEGLQSLAAQLLPHLGRGLSWIIKDSGASPETIDWAATLPEQDVIFDASADAGIYDALNRAIALAQPKYYLVVGSDDHVDGARLSEIVQELTRLPEASIADIITFPVDTPDGLRTRRRAWPLWLSSSGLTSSHAVGTLINRRLHDTIGAYDTRYRILADSLFLRRAWMAGARFDHRDGPALGSFSLQGVSSVEHGRRVAETYSYLVTTGSPRWLQACLLGLRLLRYRPNSLL